MVKVSLSWLYPFEKLTDVEVCFVGLLVQVLNWLFVSGKHSIDALLRCLVLGLELFSLLLRSLRLRRLLLLILREQ